MNCIFVLSSVTYAMKAARLLTAQGMQASPTKSGEVKAVRGCGYGVSVVGDCAVARSVLESNGIRIIGTA